MSTRRQIWPLCAAVLAPLMAAAAGTNPPLTGNWARDDGTARIAITPCGANFCAVNTWVQNPAGKERVGDELILAPAAQGPMKFQAYDVRRKLHFSMTITLTGNAMRTSGCVFLGLVCKSAGWTRLN